MPFATALAVLLAASGRRRRRCRCPRSSVPGRLPQVGRLLRADVGEGASRNAEDRAMPKWLYAEWELRDGIDPATATDGPLAPRVVAAKDGDRARQAVRCSKKEPRRSGAEAKDEARVKLHSVAILVGPVADERYGGFVDEGPQTHCKRRPRPCKLPVTFEGAYQPMRDWDANTAARVHHRTCRCGGVACHGGRAAGGDAGRRASRPWYV